MSIVCHSFQGSHPLFLQKHLWHLGKLSSTRAVQLCASLLRGSYTASFTVQTGFPSLAHRLYSPREDGGRGGQQHMANGEHHTPPIYLAHTQVFTLPSGFKSTLPCTIPHPLQASSLAPSCIPMPVLLHSLIYSVLQHPPFPILSSASTHLPAPISVLSPVSSTTSALLQPFFPSLGGKWAKGQLKYK